MIMRLLLLAVGAPLVGGPAAAAAAAHQDRRAASPPTVTIAVDAAAPPTATATAALSGIGIEDANHQLYGGLYSQMVFGESFEEPAGPDGASGSAPWLVFAIDGCFGTSQGPTWRTVSGAPSVVADPPAFTGNASQRLPGGAAVENGGLLGAGMWWEAGKSYEGSVYVRGVGAATLTVAATVGGRAVAEAVTERVWGAGGWQRVAFELVPNRTASCPLGPASPNHTATCNDAHALTGCSDGCIATPELGQRCMVCTGGLQLRVDGATLDVDQVTVMPAAADRFHGLPVRKDLAELMGKGGGGGKQQQQQQGMRLSSLRLGGSMVLCDGYRWKRFRGPREARQPYAGVWYRYDTAGWKIFETLELCEALGIEKGCVITLPVTETVADLEDLVEYAFGDSVGTKWGALRAKDGRAKPYRPFLIEIGNENTLNYTAPEAQPCRDGCANFTRRWAERALAMDQKAHALGLPWNLTYIVGFDAGIGGGQSCSQASVRQSAASIVQLAALAAELGERAVWDCHTGGDSPSDGSTTAGALAELKSILAAAGSPMRAAVLEENGGTHNMLRMLGHVTQNHALSRLGEFVVVNTVATGLQPLGRNSNGWDQGNIYFTPNASWLAPPAVATRMIAEAAEGLPHVLQVQVHSSSALPTLLDVLASSNAGATELGVRVANPSNTTAHVVLHIHGWPTASQGGAVVVQVQELSAGSPMAVRAEAVLSNATLEQLGKGGWSLPPYSFVTFRTSQAN